MSTSATPHVAAAPLRAAWRAAAPHLRAVAAPGGLAFVWYTVTSVWRHLRFGSGSWDMGCYVHNLYVLAYGKPPVSSVLGDVAFWGGTNHFMPSLYLAAPLAWTGSTSSLLVLQAALVAGTVVPLALLAAQLQVPPLAAGAVACVFLVHPSTQAMIAFDVHEIAPVPLLLFVALWAAAQRRTAIFVVALLVMAGTKESAILYAAATSLAAAANGARRTAVAMAALLCAWFFVVTAVIQPALLEPGGTMLHVGRFAALGADAPAIAEALVLHPLRSADLLLSPAQKAQTLAVTFGAFAFLPLASPTALVVAAPMLAERFLSDKREMWGLGFHYGLPLTAACAVGTLLVLARLSAAARKRSASTAQRAVVGVAGGLVVASALALWLMPGRPDLFTLNRSYMATADQAARYRRALMVIPSDAKVVAQNHFLPHLAFRQFIWQPEPRFIARADFVVLDAAASPWPQTSSEVARRVAALRADPAFIVAFSEATTVVFARRAGSAVTPTPQ